MNRVRTHKVHVWSFLAFLMFTTIVITVQGGPSEKALLVDNKSFWQKLYEVVVDWFTNEDDYDKVEVDLKEISGVQHLKSSTDDVMNSELWCYATINEDENDYIVCLSTRDCQYAVSREKKYSTGCTRCIPTTDESGKISMDCRGNNRVIGKIKAEVKR